MKKRKLILALFMILVVVTAYLYIQSNWLQTTFYKVRIDKAMDGLDGFRILQLSDLHSKVFGKNNSLLISRILEIDPDIIVMSGDMIDATGDDGAIVINLIQALAGRYPIYYSLGNHEQLANQNAKEAGSDQYQKYIRELSENDVVILDNGQTELLTGTASLHLYGFTLPVDYYTGNKVRNFLYETELEKGILTQALGSPDPEAINILLAHSPKYFEEYAAWGADLIFSGHVHGGLIRIPGVGGLMGPQQGFFPDYDGGKYTDNGKTLIVSRGKGNHILNFRINNRPEITVVDLEGNR